jgi:AAA family ATP:ADP antiporter
MITRRVGEYSFVRPGREMLFSRVDTETKYKAKNAIDVPVYRGGDALIAQVDSVLSNAGASASSMALLGAGAATLWAINGIVVGRSRQDAETPPAAARGTA